MISVVLGLSKDERALVVKTLILERLPEDNYVLLKYLAQFLAKVIYSIRFVVYALLIKFYPEGSRQERSEQDDVFQPCRCFWAEFGVVS